MKRISTYLLTVSLFFASINLRSQTATSITAGNWTSPLTWDCTCVPYPGYTVIINHAVALNTNYSITSGSITINTNGSLITDGGNRDISITSGTLTNDGTLDVRFLLVQSGSFTNGGTFTATAFSNFATMTNNGTISPMDSLYNDGIFTNNGTIHADSAFNNDVWNNYGTFSNINEFTNAGVFTNYSAGRLIQDSITNLGTFVNNNYMEFYDFTNVGTYTNNDSIVGLNSMTNTGTFNSQQGSILTLINSFLNTDPLNHDAVFIVEGSVIVNTDWLNNDTIRGIAGSIKVQNNTGNNGIMDGSFDFCDLTPPISSPYIDFNLGTIGSQITYCSSSSVVGLQKRNVDIYPNPTSGSLYCSWSANPSDQFSIRDITGRIVNEGIANTTIDVSFLPSGIYSIQLIDSNGKDLGYYRFVKE